MRQLLRVLGSRAPQLQTMFVNFLITGMGLANAILLARWVGPGVRGEIAAALAWPALLIVVGNLGIIQSTLYFSSLPGAARSRILANAIAVALLESLLLMVPAYFLLPLPLAHQGGDVILAARLYLAVIPVSLIGQCSVAIIQSMMRLGAFNALRTVIPAGYLAGTIVLYSTGHLSTLQVVELQLGLNVGTVVTSLGVLRGLGVPFSLRPSRDGLGALMRYGVKVHIGGMSSLLNERLDQVVLAAWVSSSQLGLYVVAAGVNSLLLPLAQALYMVMMPAVTSDVDPLAQAAQIQSAFRTFWHLAIGILVVSILALPPGIVLVYGRSFAGALWPAEVLLVGALLIGGKQILAGGAQAVGRPMLASVAEVVALLVTLVLLFALVPVMGILGAAVASVAAYGTSMILMVVTLDRGGVLQWTELFRPDVSFLSSAFKRPRSKRHATDPTPE